MGMIQTPCPECGSKELYRSDPIGASGGYGPNLLPGLGKWYSSASFALVVCPACGLTRFFAAPEAREKLPTSDHWTPVHAKGLA